MKLSPREIEVLDLISRGFSDKEIAQELNISARTVQTYVERVNIKLEAKNRTHAVTIFLTNTLGMPFPKTLVNT